MHVFVAPSIRILDDPVQQSALASWKRAVNGIGDITLITENDFIFRPIARSYNVSLMQVEHTVDHFPLLDSIIHEIENRHSSKEIVAFVNSDIHVNASNIEVTLKALSKIKTLPLRHSRFGRFVDGNHTSSWLAIATRIDITKDNKRVLHNGGGVDFWMWNTGGQSVSTRLPLRVGRPIFDNWWVNAEIENGNRAVIDISDMIKIEHPEHRRVHSTWTLKTNSKSSIYINQWLVHSNWTGRDKFEHRNGMGMSCEAPYILTEHSIRQRAYRIPCAKWIPSHFLPNSIAPEDIAKSKQSIEKMNMKIKKLYKYLPNMIPTHVLPNSMQYSAKRQWLFSLSVMIQHQRKDNTLLLTRYNKNTINDAVEFRCRMSRIRLSAYLMIAEDSKAYMFGVSRGYPVAKSETIFGILKRCAQMGVTVIFSRVHTQWISDKLFQDAQFMQTVSVHSYDPVPMYSMKDIIKHNIYIVPNSTLFKRIDQKVTYEILPWSYINNSVNVEPSKQCLTCRVSEGEKCIYNRRRLKSYIPSQKMRQYRFDVRIFVIGYRRASLLSRVLASINRAHLKIFHKLSLHIVVDLPPVDVRDKVYNVVDSFVFSHGQKFVKKHTTRHGLRDTIMTAMSTVPYNPREYYVVLEDDLEVSPFFGQWLGEAATNFVENSSTIIGVSLYSPRYEQVHEKNFHVENNNSPYLLKFPCSWGYAMRADRYKSMLTFERSNGNDPLPFFSFTNKWNKSTSWKRSAILYMYLTNTALVYPNLPRNLQFCTNHVGSHGTNAHTKNRHKFDWPLVKDEAMDWYVYDSFRRHLNISSRRLQMYETNHSQNIAYCL